MSSEEQARAWLFDTLEVRPAKMAKLARLAELVIAGNREQNLISKTTEDDIWWRHIVDSAQLLTGLPLAPSKRERRWIDLGFGCGLSRPRHRDHHRRSDRPFGNAARARGLP